MILIQGGRVIGPAEGIDMKADVVLDGGRIAEIIPAGQQTAGQQTAGREASRDYERVIGANGMIVAPGLVDVHVHLQGRYSHRREGGCKGRIHHGGLHGQYKAYCGQ